MAELTDQTITSPATSSRAPRRAIGTWVVVSLVAVGMVGVAIRSGRQLGTGLLDRLAPDTPGTTWVYQEVTNGTPNGMATVRVATTAVSVGAKGVLLDVHFENYLGRGSAHDEIRFQAKQGNRLVMLGYRQSGRFSQFTPPRTQLELPIRLGQTFTWRGTRDFPSADLTVTTRVVGIETLTIAGQRRTGCPHLHDDSLETAPGQADFPESVDRWLCPGLGGVRIRYDSPTGGLHIDDELRSVHGPGVNAGPPTPLAPVSLSPSGLSFSGASSAPGTLASIDTSRLAWSDIRAKLVQFPPAGRDGLVVVEEENGRVAAFDPVAGKVRWEVEIAMPAAAGPTVVGDAVLVPDAAKHLLALDPTTGATRWAATFVDVVSAEPLVVGDRAVVATEEGGLHARSLADGGSRWDTALPAPPSGLARLGSDIIVATTDGTVSAVSAVTGSVRWAGHLQGKTTAGPVAGSGVVVLADDQGQLSAFDGATGHVRWTDYLRTDVRLPIALAGTTLAGSAVLVSDGTRVRAFELDGGRQRWAADAGGTATSPTAVGDDVFVATRDNLVRLARGDGTRRALQPLPRPGPGLRPREVLTPTVIAGQLLVTLTLDARAGWPRTTILAFPDRIDPGPPGVLFSGEFRRVPTFPTRAPQLRGNDLLFLGSDGVYDAPPDRPVRTLLAAKTSGGFLVAGAGLLLTRDGDSLVAAGAAGRLWTYPLGKRSFVDTPAITAERVLVPINGVGLAALALDDGRRQWLFPATGKGGTTPLVLPGGDVVYAVGGLTRLDGASGAVRWRIAGFDAFGPITDDRGTIYASGLLGNQQVLIAVDDATGATRWQVSVPVKLLSSPAAAGSALAVIGGDNVVRVVDTASGQLRWALPLATSPAGPPVIVDNRLVISEEGRLEDATQLDHRASVYDLMTGRFLGAFEPGGSAFSIDSFSASGRRLLFPTLSGGFLGVFILGLAAA